MTNLNVSQRAYASLPDHYTKALDWRNWLQLNKRQFTARFGELTYTLEGPTAVDRADKVIVIAFEIDKSNAWLEVPIEVIDDICSQLNSTISFATVPNAYRGLFVEALLADHLELIEKITLSKISILHIYDSDSISDTELIFSKQDQPDFQILGYNLQAVDGTNYPLGLKLGNDRLRHLGRLYSQPLDGNLRLTGAGLIPSHLIRCLYGTTVISKRELADLVPGDCLLVDKPASDANLVSVELPNNMKAAGTLHNNALHISSQPEESTAKHEHSSDGVLLNFFLGEPELSDTDITTFAAGTVIPLSLSETPVDVSLNNKSFARGKLSEIDNRLVVQIDELTS